MEAEEYLENRLEDQIKWYNDKSLTSQKSFKRLRTAEIVAAALIPFLSAISVSLPNLQLSVAVIVGVLGMTVTIISGILSLGQYQERWLEYRTTCESLKKEKFLFRAEAEPYDGENAYQLLVQRVETLVSKENTNWAQYMMKPAAQGNKKPGS